MKLYMVLEYFRPGCKARIYERLSEKGRMLPDGLEYVDSWLEADGDRCFQLMRAEHEALFETWIREWRDLADFEIVEIGAKPGVEDD